MICGPKKTTEVNVISFETSHVFFGVYLETL